jgi:LPS O-antigen subunit length determinant protein (WzzB/FepE family)
MRRVFRFLIYLYPAWWRRRYGRELEALLEDSGSGWRDVWDLFRGAMEMQMSKWTFGKIVAACGIAGLAVAGALAFAMPYQYGSRAILKIPAGVQPSEAVEAALNRNALWTIVYDQKLYLNERKRMPMVDVIQQMRHAIQVHPSGLNQMEVRFIDKDPSVAQQVTQTLAARFDGFEVVDPPSEPKRVGERKRHSLAHLGLPAGLLFGVVLALILRRRKPAAS